MDVLEKLSVKVKHQGSAIARLERQVAKILSARQNKFAKTSDYDGGTDGEKHDPE